MASQLGALVCCILICLIDEACDPPMLIPQDSNGSSQGLRSWAEAATKPKWRTNSVKRALVCLFTLTLASGMLWAQGPKVAHTTHQGAIVPMNVPATTLKTIFSSLGPSATNAYNDTTGYYVLGPNNSVGDGEQWVAVPFTPAANSTVTEISEAIGWISGPKAIILGIYADDAGVPGALLTSGETNKVPAFGTCCTTVNVTVTGASLTAGTQYWVGVQTDDTNAPGFTGVFESTNSSNIAYNPAEEGWFSFSGNVPAALVRGTIP